MSEGVDLQGASPNIGVITNLEAAEGRFLSEIENDRHMNVAFIGNDIKEKFFRGANPMGQTIRWKACRSKWWACPKPRGRCSASRRTISW